MISAPALSHLADALGRDLCLQSSPVSALRNAARAALHGGLSWPSKQQEAWRYTPVNALTARAWHAPAAPSLPQAEALRAALGEDVGPRLVFVDGHFIPELSLRPHAQANVWIGSMAEACSQRPQWLSAALAQQTLHTRFGLAALNTASLQEGAVIHVGRNTRLDAPVHLVYWQRVGQSAATIHQPRTLVVADEHAEISLWEHYISSEGATTWTNAITEIVLGESAQMQHVTLQNESLTAQHTSAMAARLAGHAKLVAFALSLGGSSARREMHVHLNGAGARAELAGLYLAGASQHHDFQINAHHVAPHTDSLQNFRGILRDHATGVFSGTVYVAPGAVKANAQQLCRSLLLSAQAHVHAQPRLEILTDDVKCAHGATVGQLDHEALFYLQSRGYTRQDAEKLLQYTFAADAVDILQDSVPEMAREALMQRVRASMGFTDLLVDP